MPALVFGNAATVLQLNQAFLGSTPSNLIYNNQLAAVASQGASAFAIAFGTQFVPAQADDLASYIPLANSILANLNLTAPTVDAEKAADLADALPQLLLANRDAIGQVVLNLTNILRNLESDPNWGAAAIAYNQQQAAALAYSSNPANTVATPTNPLTLVGQTFTLTTGSDTLTGTALNDTFNAPVSIIFDSNGNQVQVDTLQAVDTLTGGGGVDTLNLTTAGGTVALATLLGIEILNVDSLAGLTLDASISRVSGLTELNINKAAGAMSITAATTTDVKANVEETTGAVTNTFNGGKNVTVTATKLGAAPGSTDTINIGGTTAASGDVVVNATGAAYTATTPDSTLAAINVTGGKTITVTQKAAADTAAVGADLTAATITQGAVGITANSETISVSVTQDRTVAAEDAAFTTGGVTETASVKFGALSAGATLTMGGLTLTATVAMTASEVASAFAGLINGAAYGTLVPAGDTQAGALANKGTYTNVFTGWTSGAANGDTVVFTSTTARTNVGDLTATLGGVVGTSVAPIITTTDGKAHDATPAGGVMGVNAGTVTIANGAALTTVTVNGYAGGSAITGANTALTTLNLSNGGSFTTSNAAAALNLTLQGVGTNASPATYTQSAGAATLNVTSVGGNVANLAAANTTTLNVSGTGTLTASSSTLTAVKAITVSGSAGLNLGTTNLGALESVNTTGTTGAVTLSMSGTAATYTGGAGADSVTLTNGTAITKAIDLGAGNDTLRLATDTVAVPTVTLRGGDGTDTLSMSTVSAETFSAGTALAARLDSFERLTINNADASATVNLENLGFTNFVTAVGSTGTLTLNNLSSGGTVVLSAGFATGATIGIKNAATGEADVLNLTTTNAGALNVGTVTVANVETINLTATDSTVPASGAVDTHTLTLAADKATTLTIGGNAAVALTVDATSDVLATINGSAMTAGGLTVTAIGKVAMTITGGAGRDVLRASTGTDAKQDVLIGGAGNDTLFAGTNGAKLTGGAGNDLFVLTAASITGGTKEANTFSSITDFSLGDLLKLQFRNAADTTTSNVTKFSGLAANLNPATAVFSNYVDAAIAQAASGEAVWFLFQGNSYVVVDSGADSASTFNNAQDLIIELVGVNLANASFNVTEGTVALVG